MNEEQRMNYEKIIDWCKESFIKCASRIMTEDEWTSTVRVFAARADHTDKAMREIYLGTLHAIEEYHKEKIK